MNNSEIYVTISGLGFKEYQEHENMKTIDYRYIEKDIVFDNPVDFGKFLGKEYYKYITEFKIYVPSFLRKTWTIENIRCNSEDVLIDWAKEFCEDSITNNDLTTLDILSYWLMYTKSESVRKAFMKYTMNNTSI